MRTFTQAQPEKKKEDRASLQDGMLIVIQKVEISTETKYDKVAHVDGYYPATNQAGRWYTTSKVVVRQLEDMLAFDNNPAGGKLKEETKVVVQKVKGNGNGSYLTLANPA